MASPEGTRAMDRTKATEMTPEGVEEKEVTGVTGKIEKIEGEVAAEIADVEETTEPQEHTTSIMDGGEETAGKGEAPEESARRLQASGNLL